MAAASAQDERAACTIQLALLRREQGRPAEAELAGRGLDAAPPDGAAPYAAAVRACLLVDQGRDSEAWSALSQWSGTGSAPDDAAPVGPSGEATSEDDELAAAVLFAEAASVLADPGAARRLYEFLLPHAGRLVADSVGAACHGSVSRQLGLLAHRLDWWEEAAEHFESALAAHSDVGAPLLLAHTRRQYAALLRVRGSAGDWERAVELLSLAEDVYRRLRIDRLADQAQAVLARSDGAGAPPPDDAGWAPPNRFVGSPGGWQVHYDGVETEVPPGRGLGDIARLLSRPALSIHAVDLLASGTETGGVVGTAATGGLAPWRAGLTARLPSLDDVERLARAEQQARLAELDAAIQRSEVGGEASVDRAERDVVAALIARSGEPLELARDAVGSRIRRGIEQIDTVHPGLAHHLRRTIRTGTFCSYDPSSRIAWETGLVQ